MFYRPQKQFYKLNPELVSGAFVYSISGFLNALIFFLLLPLLTRYLSPYDYGIIETFIVIVTLLTGVIIAGKNTLLTKEYFNLDTNGRKRYVGDILGFVSLNGFLFLSLFLLLSVFSNFLPNVLKISTGLIFWAIVVSIGNAVITILLTLLQVEKKSKVFALFVNSQTICEIGVSILLVVVLKMNWEGRITGIVSSCLVFLLISWIVFSKRGILIKFPAYYFNKFFIIALPFVLAHTSGWINEMFDKVMINNLLGVDSTGLYSIGYRFGMVILLIQEAFNRAWFPFFYENIRENNHRKNLMIVRNTYLYIGVFVTISLVFGLFGKRLLYLFVDKKFYAAGNFVFLISLGYCLYGIWKIFIGYLIYKEKIKTYSGIVVVVAVGNILLNYILLKKIGLIGSAWASLISFGIGAILTVVAATRSHPMPWLLTRNLVPEKI